MISRSQLLGEARSWLNTPWHHNTCKKGVGVDCVHFINALRHYATGRHLNLGEYRRHPTKDELIQRIAACGDFERIKDFDLMNLSIGAVLVFKYKKRIGHVGMHTEGGYFIHADNAPQVKKVSEVRLAPIFQVAAVFDWRPGVLLD